MVIKMVHHLQNVAQKPGKPEPRMISRMVGILSEMIKPAAPTQRTVDLISGNARNWGHTTYMILMDHYEAGIEELLEELSGLLTPDWKKAFEVAVRWAKRNLPRLPQDVIDHAEAMIAARTDVPGPAPAQAPEQPGATARAPQQCSAAVDTTDLGQAQVPQRRGVVVQARGSQRSTAKVTVATMTEQPDQEPEALESTPREHSPKERRPRRRFRLNNLVMSEEEIEEEPGEMDIPPPTPASVDLGNFSLFDDSHSESEGDEGETPPPPNAFLVGAQVHREDSQDEEVFQESFDRFTSPEPPRYRVHRHPNTQRKLTDWDLRVQKKWLIIGDSNLCSLPDFFNADLQVESFPGGHFRHGQALMEKTAPPPDLVVEKIILAFGINSRGNKSKETTVKTVQGALRSTKRKFPYAEIWIPQVNFSDALPVEEKENLQTLNEHIERNMPFIPLLPAEDFRTEVDDVHWTVETGSAMFDHWMAHLNSSSP